MTIVSRVATSTTSIPALSYFSHTWNMMAATNLTLTYYPHTEGAGAVRASPGWRHRCRASRTAGRRTRSTIKRGFKFNNGANVTAANFKRAFDRGKNPASQSPASSFMDDVASYKAAGQVFTVTLKKVAPDFLARMSMKFFDAVPTDLPFTADGHQGAGRLGRAVLPEGVERGQVGPRRPQPELEEQRRAVQVARLPEQRRSVPLDRRARPRDAAPDVRARRGRHLRVPARAGEGAVGQVRHQQGRTGSSS